MNKNILIASILIIIAAGGWYFLFRKQIVNRNPDDGGTHVVCTQDAKLCPDGSYVSRTGPNCEFAPCPDGEAKSEEAVIDTSNWKTYRNEEYGFEVRYPRGWSPPYYVLCPEGSGCIPFLILEERKDGFMSTPREGLAFGMGSPEYGTLGEMGEDGIRRTKVDFAGTRADVIAVDCDGGDCVYSEIPSSMEYWFDRPPRFIDIRGIDGNAIRYKMVMRILSTFKFIE
ncbi:MAG: hypothetical protein G01um101448_365 [Parcubacteria group bacterium Gr01-1014_48]|nr:MAG: hypothetical protein Greene041614_243 [Parcubacteria group bacterium Greene0416_14]TSC74062.1 MAG: hypothetical protein G01um101448_365 [Parcubacteria group bacterium Gr01-1014_48]TSD01150.1 MAG: hypothetical protein Greene101415_453 [Parcubacteria group bacterium Greene1014_15]TSD08226.1 MAG: hypothetical protein Greene07144_296 [Parcubacteria group bacterium Greene0714_4]